MGLPAPLVVPLRGCRVAIQGVCKHSPIATRLYRTFEALTSSAVGPPTHHRSARREESG